MNFNFQTIAGIVIGIIFGFLVAKLYYFLSIKQHRKDAVKRSRNVVLGHVNEKIAPLLPDFPYHYKDLVFVGKGIDYIVFDGLSKGNLKQIVFLEVKTNTSGLNRNESMIKSCINKKQVEYEIYRKVV